MSDASSKSQEQGDLLNLAEDMKASLNIRDRKYHFRTYRQCFVGEEAVSWMLQKKIAIDADHAVRIGNDMMKLGLFHHVKFEHAFRNKGYFYRFHEYGHETESEDDEPPVALANHPANSIHAKPSVRQRYALAAEVTRINRHLSALKSDLEAQGSTHGTMGDTAVEQVRETQAQVQQLEERLKQMEQWQIRLAEQNAFHWSAISLTGGAICLLACLWCLQTLSATSATLLILLIGTAGWLLHVQAGRLQKGNMEQQEALKPINTSSALRRTRSSLVPPSPTYETPDESPSPRRSSSSDDERGSTHHMAQGSRLGLQRPSHPSGRPDSEILAEPPTMEDFEECPHAPVLLRARQLPYQHFPSCNPCCIPMNSSTPVEVETDQFKGRLSIWVQGLDTSPPDLFQGKRRKTAIIIQGTFKEPLLYEHVLTGQEFGRTPTNLPARWLVDSVLLKLAKRISPSMEIGPLSKPYLMVPSVAMAQCIQVSQPGSEPEISQPSMEPQEDMRLAVPFLSSSGKPWASSKRKGWMSDKRNLQGRRFDTQHVWTFHLYQHFVDMAKYELDMAMYRFDLTRNLDGQPLQFMFKDQASGRYLFNVEAWHTGLLPAARKYVKQHSHSDRAAPQQQANNSQPASPSQKNLAASFPQDNMQGPSQTLPAGLSQRNFTAAVPQGDMQQLSGPAFNAPSTFSQPHQ